MQPATAQRQPKFEWKPQWGQQLAALTCPADEVFYGGARGGGKTEILLMDYSQDVGRGWGYDWKGIIFRKTYKQLEEIVERSQKYFARVFPKARFNAQDLIWRWPTGETLRFRHLAGPRDLEEYYGHQYPLIGFEELQNWPTPRCYEEMLGCNRSVRPGIPKKIRSTGQPLGVGHHWVKQRFVDPAPPMTPIIDENGLSRVFIPARMWDNPILMQNDPFYVKRISSIKDKNIRKAWRDGDWDIVAGSYFGDIWRRDTHVIPFFRPPKKWICFRSFDWGSAKPFSVGWWAISNGEEAPDGRIYPRGSLIRFSEWYGCSKEEPDKGLYMTSGAIGRGIAEREERFWEEHGIKIWPGPADPTIFKAEHDGQSIADAIAKAGVEFVEANNARKAGWQKMRDMLDPDQDHGPRFYVMENCTAFIRTFPGLVRDERDFEDIDTEQEDHPSDEARYSAMFDGPYIESGQKHWK